MPTPMCQLNLTLDIPTGQEIERLSKEIYRRESGVGKILLEQRLDLEKAGWKIHDKELAEVLGTAVSLSKEGRMKLMEFIKGLRHEPEKATRSSVEELVKDSYFQTKSFPRR